ncbi:YwiC-like family protein [uncultured Thermanaerothrix sp.]|uniref:YwiC-like family protein n=1 Tax=uncultured Thermanaerothrix sp. TaxID=1195149 RepID=UPI0026039C89|nr:YwiC-like family protein [uncultured Thermanaerothrix sp.]
MTSKPRGFSIWLRRDLALPQEHGAWVFLLSPLIIGLITPSRPPSAASLVLLITALAAFLLRHPLTLIIKTLSGRRPRTDLPAATFWVICYGMLGLVGLGILVSQGFEEVIWLALPALPILVVYLYLVFRRAERHRPILDMAVAITLGLGAPAAYWVTEGAYSATGWVLWGLCSLHAIASIAHTFMRLEQRRWQALPPLPAQIRTALPALSVNFLAVGTTYFLPDFLPLPRWLILAYTLQLLESLWGTWKPAMGKKPTQIGLRQLALSTLFTLFFIGLWHV